MASRSDMDRLKQLPSQTGRVISESGDIVNEASYLSADAFSSNRLMSVRGRLFFSTPRVSVAQSEVKTISLTTPADKYVIQYQRAINVESAKWNIEGLIGGTCTGGTEEQINNSVLTSSTVSESTIFVDCVLTGGTSIQNLMIPAGSRNSPGVIGAGTQVVAVYPPGSIATMNVSHDDSQPRELQVVFEFSELTQEEFDSIQDVFLGEV